MSTLDVVLTWCRDAGVEWEQTSDRDVSSTIVRLATASPAVSRTMVEESSKAAVIA